MWLVRRDDQGAEELRAMVPAECGRTCDVSWLNGLVFGSEGDQDMAGDARPEGDVSGPSTAGWTQPLGIEVNGPITAGTSRRRCRRHRGRRRRGSRGGAPTGVGVASGEWRNGPGGGMGARRHRERVRMARVGDRPEDCPVCRRLVPALRAHANARHLPWFVDASTACWTCRLQLGTLEAFRQHQSICHGGEDYLPGDWSPWFQAMYRVFQVVGCPLGVADPFDLPRYVADHGLELTTIPHFREREQHLIRFLGPRDTYNPAQPTRLFEVAHWKVVLRLIGQSTAGEEGTRGAVASAHPEDGMVFLAPSPHWEPAEGSAAPR